MSENPLLPHRKLRELHALMLHCRDLQKKLRRTNPRLPAREAALAATTVHLLPGDLLSLPAPDTLLHELAAAPRQPYTTGSFTTPARISRLVANAAAALGLQASDHRGLLLAIASAGTAEPGWQDALTWAQITDAPLILLCADATSGKSSTSKTALTWANISRLAARTQLAVLTVDGEDAVAVYRVMQESVIRARQGGGPAVIWAIMSSPAKPLPRSAQPLARLESYLAARNITLAS